MNESKPVLYVDDEENNLTVFEAAFEDHFDVHTAISAADGLRILAERPIHVLVTDMRMPGMSGVELLERILPEQPELIRIVLTGYTDVDSIIRAINQGRVHQYVTKPWDERELKMIIDRGLDRYAAAQRQVQLTAELDAAVRSEEAVRSIFQRFVPPEVTEKLLRDTAAAPPPPAEGREVTLLFADIRGFTSICSSHAPPVVLDMLNEYFARMTEIIEENSGVVNQFLGDAILAVFGAPMELVDSARFAVRAALQMIDEIERFSTRARQLIGQPLTIGIGIQQGVVALGVATAQDRAFYCAAGSPIYQVMDLEARSKGHHNSIVITEDVRSAAGDRIEVCTAGTMAGSSAAPVPLYRIIGVKS